MNRHRLDTEGGAHGGPTKPRAVADDKGGDELLALLASVVESTDDAIFTGRYNLVTSWNPGAERLYGYSKGEIVGQSVMVLVPPESREELAAVVRKLGEGESVQEYETRALRKDGTRIDVATTLSPIRDARGVVTGAAAIVRDISARKRTERELRESEAKFRRIFDGSTDGISIQRLSDLRLIDVNAEFERQTGITREQALGRTPWELGLFTDPADIARISEALASHGVVRNMEITFAPQGKPLSATLFSAQLAELGGEQCVIALVRDITASKQAQRALEESESKFRRIFQHSIDAIAIADVLDTRYLDVNDGFLDVTGFSRAEVIGKTPLELGLWTDEKSFNELSQILKATSSLRNQEAQVTTRDGRTISILFSANVIEIAGRQCALSFMRDVTDHKRAERAVVDAAMQTSQAKSDFLASMSHEIRTPMNSILGMADLLWETRLTPEQREYVRIFRSTGISLLSLIDSILDSSKVAAGRLTLEKINFDLGEVVERAVETLAVTAHSKGLELICQIAPDVPLDLVGDPMRLRQILMNIIGNALKFTAQGHVALRVECDPDCREPGALRFTIADTGVGIAPDKQQAIFESFTQVDASTARKFGGSGLGLAISQGLVQLMGGQLWVQSDRGTGSTFSFSIKLQTQSPLGLAMGHSTRLGAANVLVVDDDSVSRGGIVQQLIAQGAQVSQAEGPESALAMLAQAKRSAHPFTVVLVDMRMPTIDGFAMLERIAADPALSCRAVAMLTADNLNADTARVRRLGIADYLIKPAKRSELIDVIAGKKKVDTRAATVVDEASTATASSSERPLRILLAEDSEDNSKLILAYLQKMPYQIDWAQNGQQAFERFIADRYDLVLMDMQMPVMDGYLASTTIRQWEQQHGRARTPIIALTAFALPEDAQKSIAAGCDLHLTKPIRKATLLKAIHDFIEPAQSAAIAPHPNGSAAVANGGGHDTAQTLVTPKGRTQVVQVDAELEEIVPRFIASKRKDLDSITAALDSGDYEKIRVLGHNMKGEGGAFGFNTITEVGATLERAAKASDAEEIRQGVRALSAYFNNLQIEYRAL
jgi:two-component system sensor histidine kinase/response regulator